MKLYAEITKLDRDQRLVFGYASTEALDNQGEIVTKSAIEAALPAYMRFANIREMHQPSAVGIAEEAEIDDKGFRIGARIVDDGAWKKVTEGVYKGFSIGGKVTERDPVRKHVITGLDLLEVSLVDRPANPEAVIELYKGARPVNGIIDTVPFKKPVQIWDCGTAGHKHLGKADALKCLEAQALKSAGAGSDAPYGDVDYADPGYQPDGQKRYPLDTERHIRAAWHFVHQRKNAARYSPDQFDKIKARILAAWKAKIDPDGPPAAARPHKAARAGRLRKGLGDVARLAHLVEELGWLQRAAAQEAESEGDGSPLPDDLADSLADLCSVLRAMVAEETGELLDGDDDAPAAPATDLVTTAARLVGLAKVGARHSAADLARVQSLHDTAVALGASCPGASEDGAKHAAALDLTKIAAQEDTLTKLDQLATRFADFAAKYGALIETIANQPAPLPVARSAVAIGKEQDGGGAARAGETVDDFVARLSGLDENQRAHELTKLALRFPRVIPLRPGSGAAP